MDDKVLRLASKTQPSQGRVDRRTAMLALALRHGSHDARTPAQEQSANAAGTYGAGQASTQQARSGAVLARALAAADAAIKATFGEAGEAGDDSSEKHPLPPPCPQTASGAAELPPLENSRPNESKTSQPPAFGGRPGHGT